jgi:glycosyltransferase involved in cell wall biosynthesis
MNGKQETGKVAKLPRGKTQRVPSHNRSSPKSEIRNPKSYWTLGFSLSVLPLLLRADRRYHALPRLPAGDSARLPAELPSLSIIIPARNEARNLRRLLPSLVAQNYPGELEIIVVDDHSLDGTAEVVECELSNPAAKTIDWKLITAETLPQGWLGKPHASHAGALAARGRWLLFTDADTVHEAASAASAVAYAEAHGLDGLSLFPRQETRGLFHSAVLMVAFAGLFAGMRRSTTTLNGQYILIRREVYKASGGFGAVCSHMMDDLAFGSHLAAHGYRAPIMHGESLVTVHMYDDWRHMWHGLTRLGSGSLRYNGLMALIPAIFITGVLMPLWTLFFNRRYIQEIPKLPLIWLAAFLGYIPWAKRFSNQSQSPTGTAQETLLRALLAPAAALFVQISALWGMISRLAGRGISWKQRKV